MAVGDSAFRVDGIEKVTGQAKFTGDLSFPDLLEAKILRSPMPHAVVESIDIGKAEALPGVCAVLTRADLTEIDPFYGNCLRDRPLLALDRVRFVGEPVAVVAAVDALTAEAALELIDVRYRELPCLATVEDALAEGAVLLHDNRREQPASFTTLPEWAAPRDPMCATTSIMKKATSLGASPRRIRLSRRLSIFRWSINSRWSRTPRWPASITTALRSGLLPPIRFWSARNWPICSAYLTRRSR